MSISALITPYQGNPILCKVMNTLGALDDTNVFLKGCWIGSPIPENWIFHPPCARGNVPIYGGDHGVPIVVRARYVGKQSETLARWWTDAQNLAYGPIEFTDPTGYKYPKVTLLKGSMLTEPKPIGHGNYLWFDVEIQLRAD